MESSLAHLLGFSQGNVDSQKQITILIDKNLVKFHQYSDCCDCIAILSQWVLDKSSTMLYNETIFLYKGGAMKTSIMIILFVLLSFTITNNQAQTKWHKYIGNPVLEKGDSGEWDDRGVGNQCVLWDGTKYNMWYGGVDGGIEAIGYATSTDGISWEKYADNPVLEKGAPGEWDADGIKPSSAIFDGTLYKLWYNGWGGPRKIGQATSLDGINWTKDTLYNPVLTIGEPGSWDAKGIFDPCVIYENSTYKMWFWGVGYYENMGMDFYKIGYAESNDGITWTKYPDPVMEEGDYETWVNDLKTPRVIYENNNYTMWYRSSNGVTGGDPQINCATSSDGIEWTKYKGNPVLKEGFANKPSVIKENGLYKMWYEVWSGVFGAPRSIHYAEDFSNLVHADSVIVDGLYIDPNGDPINILGRVINPEGHALTAKAMILRDDGTTKDSVELFDDGLNGDGAAADGIYGGSYSITEKKYTVGIKTVDQVTGFTRNGLNWNITDRFTGKGPIKLDSLEITTNDKILNPGERFKFSLTLSNLGITDTIYDVYVKIIIPDTTNMANTTTGVPKFGDIAPGESLTSWSRDFAITLKKDGDSCSIGEYEIGLEITSNSETFWYATFTIDVEATTGIEDEQYNLPKEFVLEQNYPNPFNPSTIIKYSIPSVIANEVKQSQEITHVVLKIYDILGREVATLVNKQQKAEYYEVDFDASNLTSGIYFYRIQVGDFVDTKKMMLLR